MATVVKQPSEIRDLSFNLAALIAQGATLMSAAAFACRNLTPPLTTTLAAAASIDATTLSLTVNPGVGARVIVNPSGGTEESFKVSAISGTGPFTATITPSVEFSHSSGETCNYHPGASTRVLTSTVAVISGTQAIFRLRRGTSGQTYTVSVIGVCSNGEEIEDEVTVTITDIY